MREQESALEIAAADEGPELVAEAGRQRDAVLVEAGDERRQVVAAIATASQPAMLRGT